MVLLFYIFFFAFSNFQLNQAGGRKIYEVYKNFQRREISWNEDEDIKTVGHVKKIWNIKITASTLQFHLTLHHLVQHVLVIPYRTLKPIFYAHTKWPIITKVLRIITTWDFYDDHTSPRRKKIFIHSWCNKRFSINLTVPFLWHLKMRRSFCYAAISGILD